MRSHSKTKDPKDTYLKAVAFFSLVEIAVVALLAVGPGCASVDTDAVYDIYTNIVVRIPDSSAPDAKLDGASKSGGAEESTSSSFSADWRYGGFKGGGAKEDSRCRLGKGKITKDGISYRWETKIPSDWKRQSTEKGPMVIAAAFYWDGTKWVGGKFDFCDESRSSRSCANINKEEYKGWDAAAWGAANRRAFCVVSADGKLRSNVIED